MCDERPYSPLTEQRASQTKRRRHHPEQLIREFREAVSKSGQIERVVEYDYDRVGNREVMRVLDYVSGQAVNRTTVKYDYDANDRLLTESQVSETLLAVNRDENGIHVASAIPRPPWMWPLIAW